MKLFESIREQLEVSGSFVCVLIGTTVRGPLLSLHFTFVSHDCVADEVESLTAARTSSMAGSEPSDAIRVCSPL